MTLNVLPLAHQPLFNGPLELQDGNSAKIEVTNCRFMLSRVVSLKRAKDDV
jgi:hypothetical protein